MQAFDDLFVRTFPGDPTGSNVPRQTHGVLYSLVQPTSTRKGEIVAWSQSAADLINVERDHAAFSGNGLLSGMRPYASCYGGHQFGGWAGQLGDGRAIGLGESNGWEVQLKGAGRTPYSRRGDGRAVLRSSIREYLCSEIMHLLGVPTTRALSLAVTGDEVMRDMFYDGRPAPEPGAVCTRLSPSFLRFGHFELLAQRGEVELLRQLADFTIAHYFSGLTQAEWYAEVCRRTAELMVHWLRVGFVHGVMNTDNMSILGLTIDYGPYGWLDAYDPSFTPNTTDNRGRYAYARQPQIGAWNLEQLGQSLLSLMPESDVVAGLDLYARTFNEGYKAMMLAKLGLTTGGMTIVDELLSILDLVETDFTLFFRQPGLDESLFYEPLSPRVHERLEAWLRDYAALEPGVALRERTNPLIIPRNYLVADVIKQAAAGHYAGIDAMLAAFQQPYTQGPPEYQEKRPEWARSAPGCSALSCSS